MNLDSKLKELQEKGYTIIPNIINEEEINEYLIEFNKWMNGIYDSDYLHNKIHYHGIFKHFEVGHQRFAWLLRTNSKIQNVFKNIWNTDELVVSFDGCCYYPLDYNKPDFFWVHSDQSPLKKGRKCVQSFVSLTENEQRTIIVYEGTHLLHEEYSNINNCTSNSDWFPIDRDYIDSISDRKRVLKVDPGSMVLWDSRTFHQNTVGNDDCNEERIVQYLCFLPKNNENNTEEQREKRIKYFNERLTTNHYPYPISAVPLQPNTYNYYNHRDPIYIDYESLKEPYLNDIYDKILKIL